MRRLLGVLLVTLFFAAPAHAAVIGWGENTHGNSGAGYTGSNTVPVQTLLTGTPPVQIVAGAGNGYALMLGGIVKVWGGDNYGQLCNNTKGIHKVAATPVTTLFKNIVEVSASGAHVLARNAAGEVETCGSNGYGQEGNGFTAKGLKTGIEYGNPKPTLVAGLKEVVRVWAGGPDSIVMLKSGQLLGFGFNKSGELGLPKGEHTRPTPMPPSCPVKNVAAAGNPTESVHILILCQDGTVEADGQGRYGELGDGALEVTGVFHKVVGLANVTAIAAGTNENEAIVDGHVYTWGENVVGELGIGAGPEGCVQPGTGSRPCSRVPIQVPNLANIQGISCSQGFAFAWGEGVAFSWGFNLHGELGLGEFGPPHPTPTVIKEAKGVMYVFGQERGAGALIGGEAPTPILTDSVGPGAIALKWRDPGETIKWLISWRPVTKPLSTWSTERLEPAARSVTLSGLKSGQPYEVRVADKNFGAKIVTNTPE